ncbi:hypothetical protein DM558_00360 [Entomomonas moraniae]|uniref:XRE family transcriptional regulator n=1 Tax=Entomomonas moraniae TaxID=2213226 RepID=A0A3Q9JGZ2_9GAMM|nr:hypothetical protein [Entomomonas moraniae]AZS49322.1 hypothetical protein DM558_00360 [Entomomonas moraniae]
MAKRRCKTDWFRLLSDLKRFGFSHNDIFKRTSIPIGTISGYKQGSEPKHADGERLIRLWCEVTGGNREDAPTVSRRSAHF